jgi:hypothetical protein
MRRHWLFLAVILFAAVTCAAAEDDWTPLFDGKTLNGWKSSEKPGSFRVADGAIVADGLRSHLFYTGGVRKADFRNFELQAEVRTSPGANSGIYFHTRYQPSGFPVKGFEAQINNSALGEGGYRELKRTGSLYGIRSIYKSMARDGEWFTMRISVRGHRVQIRVGETLLVDYVEPENPVPDKSQPERRISSGTFALQCHDPGSKVSFRNIAVRPLPDDLPGEPQPRFDDVDTRIVELQQANFPTVDLHVHVKGGLTLEDALALSRKTGINYGIAVNCGVGFPITSDADIEPFLKTMAGQPVFVGMQAEGREWVKLFSREAVKRFDYVFTDAMTFTDHRGQRTRLWMKNEVDVPDPQAFMDMLVEKIVGILDNEPINIYVNPTFLPEVIAAQYDTLWTETRMQKVVDALVRNRIALEINSRYRIPSATFIRKAKQAGVKFTLGTNNAGNKDLGRSEYGLQMVRECGLTWQDMWLPGR